MLSQFSDSLQAPLPIGENTPSLRTRSALPGHHGLEVLPCKSKDLIVKGPRLEKDSRNAELFRLSQRLGGSTWGCDDGDRRLGRVLQLPQGRDYGVVDAIDGNGLGNGVDRLYVQAMGHIPLEDYGVSAKLDIYSTVPHIYNNVACGSLDTEPVIAIRENCEWP